MVVRRGQAERKNERESEFTKRTLDVWQARSSRMLTDEDTRQITENMIGFFRILLEWEGKENKSTIKKIVSKR
jgi:hypothetical protein